MYEQERRSTQHRSAHRSNSDHTDARRPAGTATRSREAQARARARAKARARARRLARIRAVLYVLVFAVAIFVLVTVMKSLNGNPDTGTSTENNKGADVQVNIPENTNPEIPVIPVQTHWDPVTFTAEDAALISYRKICRCTVDVEEQLLQPLKWDLTESDAKVLIIHSHVSEAYTKSQGEDYVISEDYRTDDENYNMVAIGKRVAELLRASGVEVIHDTTSFEVPNTDYAYDTARDVLEKYLREDPDITLVLDLHRDAALTEEGNQWGPTVNVDGEETARMAFAVGTNCYLGTQSHWKDNLSLTLKLQVQLEKMFPGITREILISSSSYNQDLPANFMLVEVGAAGNTFQEAMNAAQRLAEGLLAISSGTAE